MVIAALICFAILLVAWVFAPDGRTETTRVTEPDAIPVSA
jgi:hypothetical protein